MINPFAKVSRAKKTTEASLQKFGKDLRKKYQESWDKWEASPRYQKAKKRAQYEG